MNRRTGAGDTLGQSLRDESDAIQRSMRVDVANRLAGRLPEVERARGRAVGAQPLLLVAVLALVAAVAAVPLLNRPRDDEPTAMPNPPVRLVPEHRAMREEIGVRLATWTTPLETEARALLTGLQRSVDSVRERIPERWRSDEGKIQSE